MLTIGNILALDWGTILFCAVVCSLSYGLINEHLKSKEGNSMPQQYPFEATIVGLRNLDRILDFMQEGMKEHAELHDGSKTGKIKMLFQPQVIITSSIENITHILKTRIDNYGKGPNFSYRFQALLGDGIFNTDGEKWYNHRKTSSHLFNLNKFKTGVLDTFNEHADTLVKILSASKAVDIQALMFKFTLDSIGRIAFGSVVIFIYTYLLFTKYYKIDRVLGMKLVLWRGKMLNLLKTLTSVKSLSTTHSSTPCGWPSAT